ncbi:hypothetical protein Bbelb_313580 [Branchiostoma belcheri]|nr:hypothetical protein Bbelb_313580 [Branchiostoma belcheri]
MFFFGVRVQNSLQLVTVLLIASVQHARCQTEKYIDKYGYLKWNLGSNVLVGAENRLDFRFRYCNNKGVLIYQQGEGRNFFALGVNDERLYIEASIDGLAVQMYVGEVPRNQTHDVTITGLRTLNAQTRVIINGISYTPEILTDVDVNLDFSRSILVGETLIGGYEAIDQLRLNTQRLKAYPIICITFIRAGQANIDLNNPSSQLGVSDRCVVCLPPSVVTLTTVTSYLRMRIDNTPRSNTVISLKFRTKAPDGLLFYFGGPAYLALYLEGGALVLRLNTKGSGDDTRYRTTTTTFNDGEMQEVSVTRAGNVATLRDGAGNIIAQVIFGGSQNPAQALNAEQLYVGGLEDVNDPALSENIAVRRSFTGCLEELRFASYSAVQEAPRLINFKDQNEAARDVDFSTCLEVSVYTKLSQVRDYINLSQISVYTKLSQVSVYTKRSQVRVYTKQSQVSVYTKLSQVSVYTKLSQVRNYTKLSQVSVYTKLSQVSVYTKLSQVSVSAKLSQIVMNNETTVSLATELPLITTQAATLSSSEVNSIADTLQEIVNENATEQIGDFLLTTVDDLIKVNVTVLQQSQEERRGPTRAVQALETFADTVILTTNTYTAVRPGVALQATDISSEELDKGQVLSFGATRIFLSVRVGLKQVLKPYLLKILRRASEGTSEALRRIFNMYGFKTCFRPTRTLRNILVAPRDKTSKENRCGVLYMYHIKCQGQARKGPCKETYIETGGDTSYLARMTRYYGHVSLTSRSKSRRVHPVNKVKGVNVPRLMESTENLGGNESTSLTKGDVTSFTTEDGGGIQQTSDISILLPPNISNMIQVNNTAEVRLSYTLYNSSSLFVQTSQRAARPSQGSVGSRIIGGRIAGRQVKNLPEPVIITFKPLQPSTRLTCGLSHAASPPTGFLGLLNYWHAASRRTMNLTTFSILGRGHSTALQFLQPTFLSLLYFLFNWHAASRHPPHSLLCYRHAASSRLTAFCAPGTRSLASRRTAF